ncbi:hypothetical protein [Streptomyces pseudogriseolus]|uniref:hypothetical protein n=1 Tax=Streptomyces pseudogriseolus TaxID=36817 RepID=UPI0036461D25
MEALGRLFNIVQHPQRVNLRDAGGVTVVCFGTADTFTLQEANAASGGTSRDLDVIDHYYATTTADGRWTLVAQTADAVVDPGASVLISVFEVEASWLSDGYDYISVTPSSTGECVYLLRDLHVQRKPTNLAAAGVGL